MATSAQAAQRFVDTRAADNFRNLFELPVLFYAALGIAFAIGATGPAMLVLAWVFVVLRDRAQRHPLRLQPRHAPLRGYAAGGFVLLGAVGAARLASAAMTVPARLRWRCRRGTRELDVLLGWWLDARFAAADAAQRQRSTHCSMRPIPICGTG